MGESRKKVVLYFLHMRLVIVVLALVAAGFVLPKTASPATHGDLVKTAADPAVYYLGADGRRYVFPNASVYASWYGSFAPVRIIPTEDMAALPIGGNVTYRPGVRLLKVATDPKTYVVGKGGMLRHVVSEEVAECLYGPGWMRKIDDVPVESFADYRIGTPVAACGAYDVVGETAAAVTIGADRRIGAALPDVPPVPTFSLVPIPGTATAGHEAALLELSIATPVPVVIRNLPVRIEAMASARPAGSGDDDIGGIVHGASSRANLTGLRIVDGDDAGVLGPVAVSTLAVDDQAQTLDFNGALKVPAGVTRFRLIARFDDDVPSGEPYRAAALLSRAEIVMDGGVPAEFLPRSDLRGGVVVVEKGSLAVTAAEFAGPKTHVRGARDVELAAFSFRAGAADRVVRRIVFQGYVDEQEGVAGYIAGGDADNGSETHLRDLVAAVSLHDAGGALVAGPVEVPFDGRPRFEGLGIAIPAGAVTTYVLRGDLRPDAPIETRPDLVAFDIADAAHDLDVVDGSGSRAEAIGEAPNGGATPKHAVTVRKHGILGIAFAGSRAHAIIGRDAELGTLTLAASHDDFVVTRMTFPYVGGDRTPIGDVWVAYTDASGRPVSARGALYGNDAYFGDLAIPVARDKKTTVALLARTVPSPASGSGVRLKMLFGAAKAFGFTSAAEGRDFDERDLQSGEGFSVTSNVASDAPLRRTSLSAARSAETPSGYVARGASVEILRFALTAGPEGPARVKRLAFRLRPGDAGADGHDNDALERWADVNGDFFDDNDLIDLVRRSPGEYVTVGEGSGASIRYSIFAREGKDQTPQGIESRSGGAAEIEIVFADGAELEIGAGATEEFSLGLKTDAFAPGDWGLDASLLGGSEFLWTDGVIGPDRPLDGSEVRGLPIDAVRIRVR